LAMPTMSPFLPSSSFAFTAGIIGRSPYLQFWDAFGGAIADR
jgi:hypothetical protein